jgi:tetratricopeptide (TPR) repeat protein
LNSLGECLFLENRDAEAEATLRRALALEGNREDVIAAGTKNYLALVVKRKGDFNDEVQLLKDAVRIDRQTEGAESPAFAIALHNLASAQMDLGDLLGGETTEREALKIRRRISGNDHPELAYPLNNLGWVLLAEGNWREAEPLLAEALAIRRKALGDKHPLTAGPLNNWARVLQAKRDYTGADEVFTQALGLIRESSGPQSWATAKILSNLGLLQLDRGDYAAAERYARQALEIRTALGGDDNNNDVAVSLIEVGVAREYQNDAADAEQLFRRALESRRKKFPAWHPDLIAAEVRLGEVLTTEGRLNVAEPLLREAVSSAHSAPFPLLPWQVGEAEVTYGVCLAKLGRGAESQAALSKGLPALSTYPEAAMHRKIERLAHSAFQPPPA